MKIFRTKHKLLNFWLDVALIVGLASLLLYVFFWPVRISGFSMSPGVNHGDQLIFSRFLGRFGNLSSGDVVLVNLDGRLVVKRLAATGGDHVLIAGDRLYVNGILAGWPLYGQSSIEIEKTLLEGEVFLLGDNLSVSTDSRHFGPVDQSQIVAKILIRYFPFTDIKFY